MDKMTKITSSVPHRHGFTLMITLSVLSVVIALTVVLLSYFTKVREDAAMTKALIQANVYYADVVTELKKIGGPEKIYNKSPSFRTPDGRFFLAIACHPLSAGININWLGMDRKEGKQHLFDIAQILYDTMMETTTLEDPSRLLEMILLEVASGQKFIKQDQSRLMQKNGIISYQQFSDIISRYEIEIDDLKVANVPWQRYFSFSDRAETINIDYSSAELISFLFDIDVNSVREWKAMIEDKPSLQVFVENNGGDYAQKKNLFKAQNALGESQCAVRFGEGYRFTFDYIDGEAKYFEFFGKN
jgi:hypothetical protein